MEGIHPSRVPELWKEPVSGWLREAMAHSIGETADDLALAAAQDRAQLWIAFDDDGYPAGAMVTRVYEAGIRALHVVALGGADMTGWIDLMITSGIEFARACGCSRIVSTGRPGWKKTLERHQFKPTRVTYEMEISHV